MRQLSVFEVLRGKAANCQSLAGGGGGGGVSDLSIFIKYVVYCDKFWF